MVDRGPHRRPRRTRPRRDDGNGRRLREQVLGMLPSLLALIAAVVSAISRCGSGPH
jgi:hypothetical protein